jgi:hypothetical protein
VYITKEKVILVDYTIFLVDYKRIKNILDNITKLIKQFTIIQIENNP